MLHQVFFIDGASSDCTCADVVMMTMIADRDKSLELGMIHDLTGSGTYYYLGQM